jgi:hypothetical protein
MMANEHWYLLKVRTGFETVVAQKLLKLNLQVLVPDDKSGHPSGHIYCRFAVEKRLAVTSTPGVIAILGAPEPTFLDEGLASLQTTKFS